MPPILRLKARNSIIFSLIRGDHKKAMPQSPRCNQKIISAYWPALRFQSSTDLNSLLRLWGAKNKNFHRSQKA